MMMDLRQRSPIIERSMKCLKGECPDITTLDKEYVTLFAAWDED